MATKRGSRGRCIARKGAKRPDVQEMASRIFGRLEQAQHVRTPVDPVARLQVTVILESDVDAIAAGAGTVDHFARIAGQVSASIMLCQADIGGARQYLDVALAARDALDRAAKRHLKTCKWGLDGQGVRELRDFITLRDALMASEENTVAIEAAARQAAEAEIRAGNCIKYQVEAAHG